MFKVLKYKKKLFEGFVLVHSGALGSCTIHVCLIKHSKMCVVSVR